MTNLWIWESPQQWGSGKVLWGAGVSSVCLYAFLLIAWPTVGSPAETISALLGLGSVLTHGKGVRNTAPLWLLLAAIFVQILTWTLGYYHHPQWMTGNPQIDRLAKLYIFIAIAWWLGGSTRNTLILWSLCAMGLLVATFTVGGGIQEWKSGLSGVRIDFNIRNAQHTSMVFGVCLVALLSFAKRVCYSDGLRLVRTMIWTLSLSLCVLAVFITKTRAVWLALSIVIPLIGVLCIWHWRVHASREFRWKPVASIMAIAIIITISAGSLFHEAIVKRVLAESQTIAHFVEGDYDEIDYKSVGNRLHSWRASIDWIKERPLVGWGENGRSLVIDETEWIPEKTQQKYGHLHNSTLELLVSYGFLGFFVLGAIAIWIARGSWLSWYAGVMPNDVALFAVSFFVYWVIVNQFESYVGFWSGVYVHNIILGGLVTHIWRWQCQTGNSVISWPFSRN